MAGENGRGVQNPNAYSRPESVEAAFNAAVAAQENQRAKDIAAKALQKTTQQLKDAIKQVDNAYLNKIAGEKDLAAFKKTLLDAQKAYALNPTPSNLQNVNNALANVASRQSYVDKMTANLKTAEQTKTNLYAQLTGAQTPPGAVLAKAIGKGKGVGSGKNTNNTSGTNPVAGAGDPPGISYIYNAPMVKTAYLNPGLGEKSKSPQQTTAERPISDPGLYSDAAVAWSPEYKTAKGTLQMERRNAVIAANALKAGSSTYDGTLYGFKFLYNPKEVNMTWGIAEGVNWEGIAAGLDATSPITPALLQSTVSFSLLLNRTHDMQYLDSNGLATVDGVKYKSPYPLFNLKPGKTIDQELAEIYKKGTMYDMEYLFKTVMGINATYESWLNKQTADKGWLQGGVTELHLGDGMRYLVRVSGLDITHVIFNERMVPVLSTVNITCTRFNDLRTPDKA